MNNNVFESVVNTVETELANLGSSKTTCEKIAEAVAKVNNADVNSLKPVISYYLKNRGGVKMSRGRNGGITLVV